MRVMLSDSLALNVIGRFGDTDTRENPGVVTLIDVMFWAEDEVLYRMSVSGNGSPPLTVTFVA